MTSCYTTIAISRRAGYFKFREDDEYDCEAISAKRSFQCEASIAEMEACLFWELKKNWFYTTYMFIITQEHWRHKT